MCRCGARWAGNRTAHCSVCHLTFSGVDRFDKHRRNGACVDPVELGMSLVGGRAFEAWGFPNEPAE